MAGTGDPLRYVAKGDALKIGADTWNAIIESCRKMRAIQIPPKPGIPREQWVPSMVRVRNNSADDLSRFSVVDLRGPTDDDAVPGDIVVNGPNEYLPMFVAGIPGTDAAGASLTTYTREDVIAVLMEPITSGGIGWAMVGGAAHVRLSASDGSHLPLSPALGGSVYCDTAIGITDYLVQKDDGRFQVILGTYASVGTGTSEFLVLMGRANKLPPYEVMRDDSLSTRLPGHPSGSGDPAIDADGTYIVEILTSGGRRLNKVVNGARTIYNGVDSTATVHGMRSLVLREAVDGTDNTFSKYEWFPDSKNGITETVAKADITNFVIENGRIVGYT